MDFRYQSEQFSQARYCLMLPHPRGEAEDIAAAFHECSLGLHRIAYETNAHSWINKLKSLMDTSGTEDPQSHGKWVMKAERLTDDDQLELSEVVDNLAHWFEIRFWSVH